MRKKWLFLLVSFLGLFLLSLPPLSIASSSWKWPSELLIGTPAVGTGSHASTSAWGAIMEKMTGMKIRVIPEGSEGARARRLLAGELKLSSASLAEPCFYIEGGEAYVELPKGDFRIVWHHNDTPWAWAVRGDSELKTIYDIKKFTEEGKKVRVAVNTSSSSMVIWAEKALPAFLGILDKPELMKNIVFVPLGSYPANVKSLAEGKADVAMIATISSVVYEIEAHPKGLRILDKPAADKKGWVEVLKWRTTPIPGKIRIGAKSTIGREGWLGTFLYWSTAQVDSEFVYQFVKWLNENFPAYKDTHELCSRMSLDLFREFLDYCPAPIHEGTIKYLKEIGKWKAKDDTRNQEAIRLMNRYIETWKIASTQAKEKNIKIAYDNKEWVELWDKLTKDIPKFTVKLD